MNLIRKALVGASMTAVAVSSTLTLGASPAGADVWDCRASVNRVTNTGHGWCNQGFGTYHVRVECNSAHWPYTRNIDGPWVTKWRDQSGPTSTVRGDGSGCVVVKAWYIVVA